MQQTLYALVISLLFATSAAGVVITVHPDGSGDQPTIQAAVNASADGDIIELTTGVFTGLGNVDVNLLGRAITIRSSTGDAATTTIDCEGDFNSPHRAFLLESGETASTIIEALTMVNGYIVTPGGGAILCDNASPRVLACVFTANTAEGPGGAILCTNSSIDVDGCTFEGNHTIGDGGAISCELSTPVVRNSLFQSNIADMTGAGFYAIWSDATVHACLFRDGTAYAGGGVNGYLTGSTTVSCCTFSGNVAEFGAAIHCDDNDMSLVECVIYDCTATQYGAGCYAVSTDITCANSTFADNHLGVGALGSGFYLSFATLLLDNSIIAYGDGEAIACEGDATATLACCDIYGNTGGDWTGCIAGQLGVDGNISLDPLFCDADQADYGIEPESPCVPHTPPNEECFLIGALPVCTPSSIDTAPSSPTSLLCVSPNPVRDTAKLSFTLPPSERSQTFVVEIFGPTGRRLFHRSIQGAESSHVVWNPRTASGKRVPNGAYIARFTAGGTILTQSFRVMR